MHISFATENEKNAVRDMWKYCFGDSESYINTFFSQVYKTQNTIVAYDNNKPIGSLQMFPHTVFINGQPKHGMYIGGVSVLPSHRGKGTASHLMEYAENYMKDKNIDISFLVPFHFKFYEKLGYKCVSYLSDFTGAVEALLPFILTDSPLLPLSSPPVMIYENFVQHRLFYLKRDAQSYKEIFHLCEDIYCYMLSDDSGYILYTLSNDAFYAVEFMYKDEIALRRLLGFIYMHRAQVKAFRIRTSADGVMRRVLCENTIHETRYPHAMAKTLSHGVLPDSMHNYINMLGWF